MLILTGLRLNEVARASRSEFDLTKRAWEIPKERMKGKNHKARPHLVPLTSEIMEILDGLPTFEHGDFLFSTTHGRVPVSVGSKVKENLDTAMLDQLRKFAIERGDNSRKVKLQQWQNHDLRRTVRSNLSALKVAEEVSEAILAHVPPGIKGTYNVHRYADEKREALEAWAARLREIVTPPPAPASGNVVRLRAKA
jgi:integrase